MPPSARHRAPSARPRASSASRIPRLFSSARLMTSRMLRRSGSAVGSPLATLPRKTGEGWRAWKAAGAIWANAGPEAAPTSTKIPNDSARLTEPPRHTYNSSSVPSSVSKLTQRMPRLSESMSARCILSTAATAAMLVAAATSSAGQAITRGQSYPITRAKGPIVIDGDLQDEGWREAVRIDKWYEINPGDNIEPGVRNVAYPTYDDRFFYAAIEFEDPNPRLIMAPYSDRDTLPQNADYGGIFLDTRNEGHTAYEFQVSARNVQFDAVMDDNGGNENSSPDFFWESAARINDHGWTLEIKIPFSSLRYHKLDPQSWGVMLWRNYARDF